MGTRTRKFYLNVFWVSGWWHACVLSYPMSSLDLACSRHMRRKSERNIKLANSLVCCHVIRPKYGHDALIIDRFQTIGAVLLSCHVGCCLARASCRELMLGWWTPLRGKRIQFLQWRNGKRRRNKSITRSLRHFSGQEWVGLLPILLYFSLSVAFSFSMENIQSSLDNKRVSCLWMNGFT